MLEGIILVFISFLLWIVFFLKKGIKKIGQKMMIIYNQIYIMLIDSYYKNVMVRNDLLLEEITDYYANIIKKGVDEGLKSFVEMEGFIINLFGQKITDKTNTLKELGEYYNSLERLLVLVVLILISLLCILAWLYYFNY